MAFQYRPTHVFAVAALCILMAWPASADDYRNTSNVNPSSLSPRYDDDDSSRNMMYGPHVEGHIAYMRAELGITPSQEPLWQPVADAMREDAREMQDGRYRMMQGNPPSNAVDYLSNRLMFDNMRVRSEDRFLNAFRPLYDNLSPQQRMVADNLLMPMPMRPMNR